MLINMFGLAATIMISADAAAAQTAAGSPWQTTLLYSLLSFLALVASAVLPILVKWAALKMNITITKEQSALMDAVINEGIAFAEETARKGIANSVKVSSGEKLNAAVLYAMQAIDSKGLPKVASDKIAQMVEAKLNMARDPTDSRVATMNDSTRG